MNKIVNGKKTKWQLRRRIKKLSFILALILLLVIISPLTSKSIYAKSKKELYNLNTSDTPIGFGETITGSIDDVGKSVNYTFSASSGDTILIRNDYTINPSPSSHVENNVFENSRFQMGGW